MSFINVLANKELLEGLTVNDHLTVGNEVTTKDLIISRKITLLPDAAFEGSFLQTFTEPLDADNNEKIDLYEKHREWVRRKTLIQYNMRTMLRQ
jgi:hypothetical protein